MTGAYQESILIIKLREGLYDAIIETESVSPQDLDSITFQKLLIKGIHAFDAIEEEVTVQWYLDGEVLEADTVSMSEMGDKTVLEQSHEFQVDKDPTVDQISEFYRSMTNPTLKEFIDGPTFRYLREYYKKQENLPYRDLYGVNLDVDQFLSNAKKRLLDEGSITDEDLAEFDDICNEFKYEILTHEDLTLIPPYFEVFSRASSKILEKISQNGDIGNRREAAALIEDCDTFYYRGVWQAIAYIISHNTVTGPRERKVRRRRIGELSAHKSEFLGRYEELVEVAEKFDIDLPPIPGDLPDLEHTLTEEEAPTPAWLSDKHDPLTGDSLPEDMVVQSEETDIEEAIEEISRGDSLSKQIIKERRQS